MLDSLTGLTGLGANRGRGVKREHEHEQMRAVPMGRDSSRAGMESKPGNVEESVGNPDNVSMVRKAWDTDLLVPTKSGARRDAAPTHQL
jgi:hypothetical protein